MKLSSWNVNGVRAAMDKGLKEYVLSQTPDILCLQETKATPEQVDLSWVEELGYQHFWNCAEKKGYSGTSVWTKETPKKNTCGIGFEEHDKEGRVLTLTFEHFHLVNVYTPNSQRGLARLDYRQAWDRDFLDYVRKLNRRKPVVFCGDLNCSHKEIDLANPKANRKNAGFTDEERAGIDRILDAGFEDSFRMFNEEGGNYSWWTYRMNARERNVGWRLDYFMVSQKCRDAVVGASICDDVMGSDHCPVELKLEF